MNIAQLMLQIRTTLRALQFPDGNYVFTNSGQDVYISRDASRKALKAKEANTALRCAVIYPEGSTADADRTDIVHQSIGIRLIIVHPENTSDEVKELPIVSRLTTSPGLELVREEVVEAIRELNQDDGINMTFVWSGVSADSGFPGGITEELQFAAVCTLSPSFMPHRHFRVTAQTSSSISLSWRLPPTRYDTVSGQILRYLTSGYPSTPSAGTGVTVAAGDQSVTVSGLASGTTYYFSLFQGYDTSWPLDGVADEHTKVTVSGTTS